MSETTTAPAQAGLVKQPEVRCAHVALVDPKTLCPHPRNPNKHPPKQLDMFIAILGYQGWRRPITVSKLSGFVTKGHGALEAALLAGYPTVPVDYQDYASEAEEQADLVADNQLQRMSEMDPGKLQALLVNLNTGAFNMELTGFDSARLEKLLEMKTPPNLAGGEGAPNAGAGGPADGTPPGAAQVRMVQLFFDETTQPEFLRIVEFFQKELGTANATDTVLAILRSAFDAHTADGAETSEEAEAAAASEEASA